jgi:hypothetical protein
VIRYAKIHGSKHRPWLTALLARRPTKVAAIALANKITARNAEPVDPAIRTTHMGQCIVKCGVLTGT